MKFKNKNNAGFSMLELMIAMTIMLVLLGIVTTLFSKALGTRERESRKTDALTAAQAALNVMSREIANSGFGLTYNGIVTGDSNSERLHFRSNIVNSDLLTNSPGEDITFYFDSDSKSIVRYDPNGTPKTSAIVNKISDVTFQYFDYFGSNSTPTAGNNPTTHTGRIRITIWVELEEVQGQSTNQSVEFVTDVTLRNSDYMLNQY
jgi:prepilin-type N-terminal cleavage/methylation domain-containing protein